MEQIKIPFFSRIKRAIFNPESYSVFMLEKTKNAIFYLLKLLIIFTIIFSLVVTFNFYKNGVTDEIKVLEDYGFDQDYISDIQNLYEETNDVYLILTIFFVSLVLYYSIFTIAFLLESLIFGLFAFIIARICGIRLKYSNGFNIAIYAITLPTILLLMYNILDIIFGISIKYFSVAHDAITYIYIITAILMIRADLIKQKIELTKIIKEQQKVEEEMKQQEDDKKEDNDEEKKKKKDKEGEGEEPTAEPEGNKA